ncbi:MAG TPA: EAL domain-containing protein [Solirubrobacteraceae bacterium]|nr:EAL domain-containing protein [Solirubrobacteraceae bacterium]
MSSARAPAADMTTASPAVAPELDYLGLLHGVPAILYTSEAGELGRWRYVSPQIERILGFTAQQWCADPALWSSRLHPDDRERVLNDETMIAQRQGMVSEELEYRLRHRDGHYVWVRDDAVVTEEPDGTLLWRGVLSDITDQRRAQAELELRLAQQAAVARLGKRALEGASQQELMSAAVGALVRLLQLDLAAVAEHLPDEDAFVLRATHGVPGLAVDERLPEGLESLSGYVVRTGRATIVSDWESEQRFRRSALADAHGARCGLMVVIDGASGRFGTLGGHFRQLREITQGDLDFAQALANVLGDVVEREQTADAIRHRALHDQLTGVPNRVLFLDRLGHAVERLRRRPDALAAVLTLDLDRFKLVNDSLGHGAGDELLAAVAPRLRQAVRSSDTVARMGADEFAILLEDIGGEGEAIDMAQRIAAVFTRPFALAGEEHFLTTSIGIALAHGGESPQDLMRDAAAAMHRAKERGGARYELFDEAIRGRAMFRLRVENSLRRALERDEFVLEYQPVVALASLRMVAVEALVRWEDPERGRVMPAQFIGVCEENGLIEPLGRWVLDRACRQAAAWHRLAPDSPPVQVSVNLSPAQVSCPTLVGSVRTALRASGLDPGSLVLELTESVLAGEDDALPDTLEQLRALGVRLALDDFGTGYSSLSHLSRLPLHALKVDRSFVAGLGSKPRDSAITAAIVAMSRALSLSVVGEGVETAEQAAELARLGCDLAQGYLFSKPVGPREIERMLAGTAPWIAAPDAHGLATCSPRRSARRAARGR